MGSDFVSGHFRLRRTLWDLQLNASYDETVGQLQPYTPTDPEIQCHEQRTGPAGPGYHLFLVSTRPRGGDSVRPAARSRRRPDPGQPWPTTDLACRDCFQALWTTSNLPIHGTPQCVRLVPPISC